MKFIIVGGCGVRTWDALLAGTPMLNKLLDSRIFGIRLNDNRLQLQEQCDGAFLMDVTADDLRALAAELNAVADQEEDVLKMFADLVAEQSK
jgi:hypothetical protein